MIFNGNFIPESDSSHLYNNRGFLFGDGFFETMRMHEGQLLWKSLHSERIRRSLSLLQLEPNPLLFLDNIEKQAKELALENSTGENVRIRLSIFRCSAGYYLPETNACGYLLNIKPLNSIYSQNTVGLEAGLYQEDFKHPGRFSGIKSLSAGFYVQAALYAQQNQMQHLILCNSQGRLMEGLSSNLLLVENNTVIAPPLSEGPVEGIMQQVIKQLCEKKGILFRKEEIPLSRALEADELWLSNVISGIQWISHFEGRRYRKTIQEEMAISLIALSGNETI